MEAEEKKTETPPAPEAVKPPKGGINMKIILFGLPLFILQLIIVYFVTANILLNKVNKNSSAKEAASETVQPVANKEQKSAVVQKPAVGKYLYSVDDIIVNPAGTNGDQLLLSSLAFDLATEDGEKEIKGKEIVVKDLIISILSSKTITQLSNSAYKDTLRAEISKKVQELLPNIKVNKVYFSKYIIN